MWNTPSQEQLNRIPRLYETEHIPAEKKLIYLHFFIPKAVPPFAKEGADRFIPLLRRVEILKATGREAKPLPQQDYKNVKRFLEVAGLKIPRSFTGGCDWYITEFDGDDLFFGFAILNSDYEMAEWGYISFAVF